MKKIIALLLLLPVVLALSLPAAAAAGTAGLKAEADCTALKAGDSFVLNITLDNVTDESGVSLVDMAVKFDSKLFEFVSFENTFPDDWGSDTDDFTRSEDGVVYCTYMNAEIGFGAKDGELSSKLVFKALSDDADGAEILIDEITIANDSYSLNEIQNVKSITVKINFGGVAEVSGAQGEESSEDTSSSLFDESDVSA